MLVIRNNKYVTWQYKVQEAAYRADTAVNECSQKASE